jgi:LCP family protein required for cell wall assembly
MEPLDPDLSAAWRKVALFFFLLSCSAVVMAGCSQRIFVGLPTPSPEVQVISPENGAPVPPFGPRAWRPNVPVPDAPPDISSALVSVPAGPAFVWSETENYLIMGTDRRSNDSTWRTDTLMVVGIDRARQRAAVLSIPRDLYLEIPNYGYGRINQVDYVGERITRVEGGGPALLSTVISHTFGIRTNHWIRFEMTGFQDVVNAVGGVTIHLDCPFYEPIFNLDTNAWDYFTLPAGEVYMDGETAYWFVRLRLRESDIGRSQRQRQFLWALRQQVLNTNLLPRLPELWNAFSNTFSTDLTLLQLLDLARLGIGLDPANVRASGITQRELQSYTTDRGAAVLIISDPSRVRSVVEGIWDAPAMADAYRQDSTNCRAAPQGAPVVVSDTAAPTPVPVAERPLETTSLLPTPTPAPLPVQQDGAALIPDPGQATGDGG